MPGDPEIERLVGELRTMKARKAFNTFIDYIVFPRYRNIALDTRIDFGFPVTVLVGQNGSGKTAVLQALYGAPGGSSVAQWWFETAVDPIKEPSSGEGRRQRAADIPSDRRSAFYYGYQHGNEERYVLKLRIRRSNDPDYWEPSRPLVRYGMKTLPGEKRFDPIEMDPIYVNFKLNVNAFDKCFYFYAPVTLTEFSKFSAWQKIVAASTSSRKQPRIQDYLRHKSRKLKRVIDEDVILHSGKYELNKNIRSLTDEEIGSINSIIGKSYTGGKVIEHRFFEGWGTTVAFSTSERSYTDAFAGSGESSVVRLVLEVEKAKEGSLVLLDEPETSIHPGAQDRMLAYLLDRTKRKKLQVVISTHSPTLVQYLPREAVKVFSLNAYGLAEVIPNRPAEEAFHYIGHRYDARINIVVEDRLAQAVVNAAIRSRGEAFAKRFSLSFGPGGETSIKKDMVIYSRSGNVPIILLDGDQIPFNLQLMPSVDDEGGMPTEGRSLVIVADVGGVLHFRFFDALGQQILRMSEADLPDRARNINQLRLKLADLWILQKLPKGDKNRVVSAVTTLVDLSRELHVDTEKIAIGDRNPSFLTRLIEKQAGSKVEFAMDSNMNDEAKSDLFVAYLDYYRKKVFYLPFTSPEEVIWDDAACRQLLDIENPKTSAERAAEIGTITDYKKRFARLSELVERVDAVHTLFVRRFSNTGGEQWDRLVELLTRIGDEHA